MSYKDMVTTSYYQILFRAPDEPGLEYWIDRMEQGDTIATVDGNIALSEEASRFNDRVYTPNDFYNMNNYHMTRVSWAASDRLLQKAAGRIPDEPDSYTYYEGTMRQSEPNFSLAVTAFLDMIEAGGSYSQFNEQVLGVMG